MCMCVCVCVCIYLPQAEGEYSLIYFYKSNNSKQENNFKFNLLLIINADRRIKEHFNNSYSQIIINYSKIKNVK